MRRPEDLPLLTGRGTFTDDLRAPGALHCALVRSVHARARLLRVNAGRAAAVPGVVAAFTAADGPPGPLPLLNRYPGLVAPFAAPPLAAGEVRYVGEPVALVVAESRAAAEDGADAVAVECEPLAPVPDLLSAAAPDSPRVHGGAPGNVCGRRHLTCGAAVAAAPGTVAVEGTFTCRRGSPQPLEGRAVLARWDPLPGQLLVWASTQSPHRYRSHLARLLGLPEAAIRVIAPDIGGAFGQKGCFYPEDLLVPWAAMRLGRPVRWTEDRRENLLAATQDRVQVHRAMLVADRQGRLLGLRDAFLHDTGAYAPYGVLVPAHTAAGLVGPYRIPNVDIEFTALYTNLPPVGVFRGPGHVQATFVLESLLDRLAGVLGCDPADLRRRNLVRPEQMPYDTGLDYRGERQVYDSGDYPAAFDLALGLADYPGLRRRQAEARAAGRLFGVGLGAYVHGTGAGPLEGCRLEVRSDGTVLLATGAAPQGQGQAGVLAALAAAELGGIEPGDIRVVTGDTAAIEHGVGTFGSRTAVAAGGAVVLAARALRRRIIEAGASALEVSPADVELAAGGVRVRGAPGRVVALANLAEAAELGPAADGSPDGPPGLSAVRYYRAGGSTFPYGFHVAAVEVDRQTASVRVLDYTVVDDCGTPLNPEIVAGQALGGFAQGLGAALLEELVFDGQGQPRAATLADYLLPTACDVPAPRLGETRVPAPAHPLGVKGAGEGAAIPVAAAVGRAVADALAPLGVVIDGYPLTPLRLWEALQARSGAPGAGPSSPASPGGPA